ncbi:type VI immunity family protein [Acinetobacter populi]|uniref:DUF3396 domain-containing protein n=1 Tax=Acinetobacter populi TaxID=1582270 RepID=A0A1Z9Z1G3_9GAMM|nr:type VI immunity family protein [Acinetobacter populi]OUY08267.1 hypothetical protein CAP51_01200 [Acinetobacter populi]
MSTTQIYMTNEDIKGWIDDIKNDNALVLTGLEGEDCYGIGPYFSCYILHDEAEVHNLIKKIVRLFHCFSEIKNEDWTWVLNPAKDIMVEIDKFDIVTLEQQCLKEYEKEDFVSFSATCSDETVFSSAVWGFEFTIDNSDICYATFKVNFRYAWYLASHQNREIWHDFINECIQSLKPMHAYSGFEIASAPLGREGGFERNTLERIAADYFYGLDIDHPMKMGFHTHFKTNGYIDYQGLGSGIRTPVWSFMLAPYWLKQLGMTWQQVIDYFAPYPQVKISQYIYDDHRVGLWIQLGELDLYPVEEGLPPLLVYANKLIRPIRCDHLELTIYDRWEDDPNPFFDYESGVAWMRRFDVAEDVEQYNKTKEIPETLRALPEDICPKTGW